MKPSSCSNTRCLIRLLVLAFALGIFAAPAARAGLTMEVDLTRGDYQGDQYYAFSCSLNTNSTAPDVSFGNYFVVSPGWPTNANASATLFTFDTNGFNSVSGNYNGFSLFDAQDFSDSFIQNITNGQWTIFVTNAVTTNVYHFAVTASIDSNSIPLVSIIYPPNNAINVTNQPTFVWQSDINYSDQILYGPNFGYDLPVAQQSYTGAILSAGTNSITLDTYYLSSIGVVSSVPTNSVGSPLSGWVSTWHVWDYANVQFVVGSQVSDFNSDLGTTNLPWATTGDSAWFTETTNTYNGTPSADQSGSVTNGEASTLSVVVTGPGTLTYYWSSIANDFNQGFSCEFDVDGNYSNNITGDTAWYQDGPYLIGPGQHTLSWTAYANGDTDPTEAGFLDGVSYVAALTPTLTVTNSPQSGAPPLTVYFTSPAMDSFGNTVTNWLWTFGDGTTSTAQNPVHIYTNSATYNPSLMAYSTFGSTPLIVSGVSSVTVSLPTLVASASPQSGVSPLTVEFSTPSVDSDGFTVTNWSWNFGDGANSTAQSPSHTYLVPGVYSPTVVVRSTFGYDSIIYYFGSITVTNLPNPAFNVVHGFSSGTGSFYITNSDGASPDGDLVMLGNTLYGAARLGGTNGIGCVFAVNPDGSGFTNLYNLTASNGGLPVGGLVASGSTLFGVGDTVFGLSTNGTGFTNLLGFIFSINSATGYEPEAGLAVAGNNLYGTTWYGGAGDAGTLIYVSTNGATNGKLHDFSAPYYNQYSYAINYDGVFPSARLIFAGGTLYGTAAHGGANGSGTIFSVITNQPSSFDPIYSFTAINITNGINPEGAFPFAGLAISGNTLYGTTAGGGSTGNGTVFAINATGTGITNLYSFKGGTDGSGPHAGLTLAGGVLYGTTTTGGYYTNGTLFSIKTNGSGYTTLYNFTGGADGGGPASDLLLSSNVLYGTTATGGSSGNGTIFSFVLPAQLNIALAGTNVLLTWSANTIGYSLQSTAKLQTGALWSAVSPLPVVVNGLNTVTNPVASLPKFYRLIR